MEQPVADGLGQSNGSIARSIGLMLDQYGPFEEEPRLDAAHEIVFTILSQHTSDINSSRAYQRLMERFGSLEDVGRSDVTAIEDAIAPGGLAKIKAPRIKEVLGMIAELNGSFDLSFLRELPLEEAKAWLRQLPGDRAQIRGYYPKLLPGYARNGHRHSHLPRLQTVGYHWSEGFRGQGPRTVGISRGPGHGVPVPLGFYHPRSPGV